MLCLKQKVLSYLLRKRKNSKVDLFNYLKKRDLLNSEISKEESCQLGDRLLEAGFFHDALSFYEKGNCKERLQNLFEKAWQEGDYFLVKTIAPLIGKTIPREEWIELGQVAEKLGKYLFALNAYREANSTEDIARLGCLFDFQVKGPNLDFTSGSA